MENFFNDNDNQFVNDIKDLLGSEKNDITFFDSIKYKTDAIRTKAEACITTIKLKKFLPQKVVCIIVNNVLFELATLVKKNLPSFWYRLSGFVFKKSY